MLNLRVTYGRASDARRDLDQQLSRGGLMVRVATEPGLQLRDAVGLEIVLPDGTVVNGTCEVLNVMDGHGLAVTVPADMVTQVRARIGTAAPDAASGPDVVHQIVTPVEAPPREGAPDTERTMAQKIQTALHGTKDERAAILRDRNKALHPYVLKNPNLTQEEITAIAKNPQVAPELLKQIADRKEWIGRSAVAQALARNPKTPPEVGIRALEFVGIEALRQMAKGNGALPHIVTAARKRVIT